MERENKREREIQQIMRTEREREKKNTTNKEL